MKRFLLKFVRIFVSWNVGIIATIITYFSTDLSFLISLVIGACFYYATTFILRKKFSKITGPEIKKEQLVYQKKEIREAKVKIHQIGRSRLKIRSVHMWQNVTKIYKMLLKMVSLAEKEPARFRNVQSFLTQYLDSLTMIIDKYTLLISQPVKNQEVLLSIKKAEEALDDMVMSLEKEMLKILENDVLHLDIELELLKKTLDEKHLQK